jgi:hypothetical protein
MFSRERRVAIRVENASDEQAGRGVVSFADRRRVANDHHRVFARDARVALYGARPTRTIGRARAERELSVGGRVPKKQELVPARGDRPRAKFVADETQ